MNISESIAAKFAERLYTMRVPTLEAFQQAVKEGIDTAILAERKEKESLLLAWNGSLQDTFELTGKQCSNRTEQSTALMELRLELQVHAELAKTASAFIDCLNNYAPEYTEQVDAARAEFEETLALSLKATNERGTENSLVNHLRKLNEYFKLADDTEAQKEIQRLRDELARENLGHQQELQGMMDHKLQLLQRAEAAEADKVSLENLLANEQASHRKTIEQLNHAQALLEE